MPLLVAAEARRSGQDLFLIGIEGVADPSIAAFDHDWIRLGQLGRFFDLLKRRGITEIAVVGALSRPHLMDLRLDLGALRRLPAVLRVMGGGGDDALLRRLIELVEAREGLKVIGVYDVASQLVLGEGALGRIAPKDTQVAEGRVGLRLLHSLSPFDCGQAVVMIDGRPVAIEGIEGTDAMIERVKALRDSGRLRIRGRRGVLVKAPKLGQDLRIDMPVIGTETLRHVADAGLSGVIVQSGGVLVAGAEATRKAANQLGLFVHGEKPGANST
jgi:UDP-2,3-diacylglucosamine hydrolase